LHINGADISTSELLELARKSQEERFFGRHNIFNEKKIKTTCCVCRRPMESPEWENSPYYCYKCSGKHEVGNPIVERF